MKKLILLIALSVLFYSAPGYTVGLQRKFEAEWQKARADAARADAKRPAHAKRKQSHAAAEAAAPVAAAPVPQEAPPAPLEAQVEQAEEAWNLLYAQLEAVIKEWDEANALMAQLNAQFEDEDTKRATVNEEWESLHAQTTAAVEETDNAQAAWEQAKANAETKKVDEPEEYPAASALAEAAHKRYDDEYARWESLYAQTEDALKRWNDADAETARVYALAGDAYAQREACALDNKTEECEAAHEKWKKLKAQWEDAAAEVYNDAELLRVQEAQTAPEEAAPEFTMFRPRVPAPAKAAAEPAEEEEEKLAHLKAQEEQAAEEWASLYAQTEADATNRRKGANANSLVVMQRELLDSRTAKECETARKKWESFHDQLKDAAARVYKDADWWEE